MVAPADWAADVPGHAGKHHAGSASKLALNLSTSVHGVAYMHCTHYAPAPVLYEAVTCVRTTGVLTCIGITVWQSESTIPLHILALGSF